MKKFRVKIFKIGRKIRRWNLLVWRKIQKWSPIVSKRKFKRIEKDINRLINNISKREKDFAKQLKSIHEKNKYLFDKLIPCLKVEGFVPDYSAHFRPEYRIQTTVCFAPQIIETCLTHGNDQEMIKYIADEIKYSIEQELKTINFVRYKDKRV